MKGCLGIVVLFVVTALGEYGLLRYTPMSGSVGLPLLSAAMIAVSFATVWGTVLAVKRRRALAISPERWSDGDFVGFSGRITSESAPLAAPASGSTCAIYEYALKCRRESGDHPSDATAFHGMGMSGCRVQSGVHGFRLVGFPILTRVPKTVLSESAALERFAGHLLRSEVRPKPQGVGATLRSLADVLADADGIVRFDEGAYAELDLTPYRERFASDPTSATKELTAFLETERSFIEEAVVPEGQEVTVFGAYRSSDRSIDVGSGLRNMERGLSLGTPGATSSSELVRALITLVVVLGATVGVHRWIVPPLWASRTVEPYRGQGVGFDDALAAVFNRRGGGSTLVSLAQSEDAPAIILLTGLGADANGADGEIRPLEQAGKPATVKALLDAGANPSISGHQGNSPLHHCTERGDLQSVRLLLAHGAPVDAVDDWGNTPLSRAAVYGHVEIGRALLEAKADANHRAKDGSTPLDEARANGHREFVDLVRSAGARETEVTAETGKPVALGDAPIRLLQAYEDALHARDTASLGVLKPAAKSYDWSSTDWEALLGGRPVKITEVTGYADEKRATVRVNGPTADGRPRGLTVGYELARDPAAAAGPLAGYDGWHIEREWIEWGELSKRR